MTDRELAQEPYTQIAVVGRAPNPDGSLSIPMIAMAKAATEYYHGNPSVRRVVFLGSSALVHEEREGADESDMTAEYAEKIGLPTKVIRTSGGATTFDNYHQGILDGYLDIDKPTKVAAHGGHRKRSLYIADRIFMAGADLLDAGEDYEESYAKQEERILLATKAFFIGVKRGNLSALNRRHKALSVVTSPLYKFIK